MMNVELSRPLDEPPSFLSLVSMVGDDERYTIQQLRNAESPSPELYGPARELFIKILEGNFSFDYALSQAHQISDGVERQCAEKVLGASKRFLLDQTFVPVRLVPSMWFELPNKLRIRVTSIKLRQFRKPRILVLYFWKKPLSAWQLSAAATILRSCLDRFQPHLAYAELEFISVAEEGNPPNEGFAPSAGKC
jgi:hypothetical protein